jgi:serine protease SohB
MFDQQVLFYTVFVLAIVALVLLVLAIRRRNRGKYRLSKDSSGFWRYHKETKFERKEAYGKRLAKDKKSKNGDSPQARKSIAVLEFDGDIKAKQHDIFANLVDEVTINKDMLYEVVVSVTSPGGMVPHYGHVFSQMERLRSLGIQITVCIDVVAASGGYLLSLPAHKIVAAPFAMVGSIGVAAFVPNIRQLLKNWSVQPRTFTAGKYKRTVNLTDDATEEEIAHFKSQLDTIHRLFLDVVRKYRPQVEIELVETGDHWTATESIDSDLKLVDELGTANDYLLQKNKDRDLIFISQKRSIWENGFSFFSAKLEEFLFNAGR